MPDAQSADFAVGQQFTGLLAEDLSRPHIAQYAGASGDFNRVHVDEAFATQKAGRDAVIAHGMFTMGLTASFITSLIGPATLRSFGGRFLAAVVPGDTLMCVVTVAAVDRDPDGPNVTFQVETTARGRSPVFAGSAVARFRGD
ncbi:MaoC/PaaZ C-terminal domain-containing protein [Nocardioides immobilis]|nr:MaoC/PaaZ C-terminal domain-containing protein [Nocardioides immobilis]